MKERTMSQPTAYQVLIGAGRDTTQQTIVAATAQDARDEVLSHPDATRQSWWILDVREVELFPEVAA
jgi:hypothetical protein